MKESKTKPTVQYLTKVLNTQQLAQCEGPGCPNLLLRRWQILLEIVVCL